MTSIVKPPVKPKTSEQESFEKECKEGFEEKEEKQWLTIGRVANIVTILTALALAFAWYREKRKSKESLDTARSAYSKELEEKDNLIKLNEEKLATKNKELAAKVEVKQETPGPPSHLRAFGI